MPWPEDHTPPPERRDQLAAIIHRLRTGEGQHIEIAMMECFSAFLLSEHLGGNTFVPPNGPSCYFRQINPDRQPCITRDGAISIVASKTPSPPGAWLAMPIRQAKI